MSDGSTVLAVSGQGIAAKALEVMGLAAGKPYVWNGKTLAGFDCSGFVAYVFKQLLPNNAAAFDTNVAGFMASTLFEDVTERRIGDLIVFPAQGGTVNHIGIVYSETQWIGSQSSTGVALVKFTNPYWSARPHGYRRLKATSPVAISLGHGRIPATA